MAITLDELLPYFDKGPHGELRILINGHQRFCIAERGACTGDNDFATDAYGYQEVYDYGHFYVAGRSRVQTMIGMFAGPETKDLSASGAYPESCAFAVQATNIPDQVVANFWTGDRIPDNGHQAIGLFVSTADTHRPGSASVAIRADAINNGPVKATDYREVGQTEGTQPVPPTTYLYIIPYPGDAWIAAQQVNFRNANPANWGIFFGRMMWDLFQNGDNRPTVDYAYYLDKHLNEARA